MDGIRFLFCTGTSSFFALLSLGAIAQVNDNEPLASGRPGLFTGNNTVPPPLGSTAPPPPAAAPQWQVDPRPFFTDTERAAIVQFWNQPGRYFVAQPADAKTRGLYQVRQTVEGSMWFWNYNQARGLGKVNPTIDAGAQNAEQQAWERWIDARLAFEYHQAEARARQANRQALGIDVPVSRNLPAPAPPPAPQGLVRLAGNPPPFAAVVMPVQHVVRFETGHQYSFVDNIMIRPRYAYYRFAQGVTHGGTPLSRIAPAELQQLFRDAGLSDTERKVMSAVSPLEGGFDSVNTYDTGFVSVGFIQFAALSTGSGSLGQAMVEYWRTFPNDFLRFFKRYGISVNPNNGQVIALDPSTGAQLMGIEAVFKIIDDKRLTAVFQHAGRNCRSFQMAQIRASRTRFYPADDVFDVRYANNQVIKTRVGDVIRSEAGLATLMDRKVNLGNIRDFANIMTRVARERGANNPQQLAQHERQMVSLYRFRRDFLRDPNLTQPR